MFKNKKFSGISRLILVLSMFGAVSICSCKKKPTERDPGYTDEELANLSPKEIGELVKRMTPEQRKFFYDKTSPSDKKAELLAQALKGEYLSPEDIEKLMDGVSAEDLKKIFENKNAEWASKYINALTSSQLEGLKDSPKLLKLLEILPAEIFNNLSDAQRLGLATVINGSPNEEEFLKKISGYNELKARHESLLTNNETDFWNKFRAMSNIPGLDSLMGPGKTYNFTENTIIQELFDELKKPSTDIIDITKVVNGFDALLKAIKEIYDHTATPLVNLGKPASGLEALKDNPEYAPAAFSDMHTALQDHPEQMDPKKIENGVKSMIDSLAKYYDCIKKLKELSEDPEMIKLKSKYPHGTIASMFAALDEDNNDIKNAQSLKIDEIVKGIIEMAKKLNSLVNIKYAEIKRPIDPGTLNWDGSLIATLHRLMQKDKIRNPASTFNFLGYARNSNPAFNNGNHGELVWTPAISSNTSEEVIVKRMVADLAASIYNLDPVAADKGVGVLKMQCYDADAGGNRTKLIFKYGYKSLVCELEKGKNGPNAVTGGVDFDYAAALNNLKEVTIIGE